MLNKLLNMVYNASEHGRSVDHMLEFCHWFMLILFIGWGVFLTVAIFRFRSSRNPKANYHGITGHASTHAEFSVVLIEAALLLGFAIPLWGKRVVDLPEQGGAPCSGHRGAIRLEFSLSRSRRGVWQAKGFACLPS